MPAGDAGIQGYEAFVVNRLPRVGLRKSPYGTKVLENPSFVGSASIHVCDTAATPKKVTCSMHAALSLQTSEVPKCLWLTTLVRASAKPPAEVRRYCQANQSKDFQNVLKLIGANGAGSWRRTARLRTDFLVTTEGGGQCTDRSQTVHKLNVGGSEGRPLFILCTGPWFVANFPAIRSRVHPKRCR